jgi:hypothetical protein
MYRYNESTLSAPHMNVSRPIFIVAAPRSGSTLLFETLMRHQDLWSFGDEGHGWIEKYAELRPLPGGVASNRLTEVDLTPERARDLRQDMINMLVDHDGTPVENSTTEIRLVEKTPKNCLRIPFINAIYPDALFVYLYRDPCENIASIMEGWRHQRFVTYMDVRTRYGYWNFLRPPGWHKMVGASLEDIAAYQWALSHDVMLKDLARLDHARWTACSFEDFLADPADTVKRIEQFCGLTHDDKLARHCEDPLPHSRYTQTPPSANKWRAYQNEISSVFPKILPVVRKINTEAATEGHKLRETMGEP